MYHFRRCPICRAYLDPGEICDCQDKENGQKLQDKKEAAPVLEHRDGPKVESELTDPHSTSEYKPN